MRVIIHNSKILNNLFYLSIVYFLWSVTIKFGLNSWWQALIGFLAISGFTYGIFKKFSTTQDLDSIPKRVFNSKPHTKFFISLILITVASIIIFVPQKVDVGQSIDNNYFGGIIWDEDNEPLPNVVVALPEINLADTTDVRGNFYFDKLDTNYTKITVIASKYGYHTYEGEGSIGNLHYNFNMIKK